VGDPTYCCWYGKNRKWLVSTTDKKDANHYNETRVLCRSVEDGLDVPQLVKKWEVDVLSYWKVQPTATTTNHSTEAHLQHAIEARLATVGAPGFTFNGATGVKAALVNGIYQKQKEKESGKSVYGQVGEPAICCFYFANKWRISIMDSNTVSYAWSMDEGVFAPQLVKSWTGFVGEATITSHDEAQLQAAIVAHMAVIDFPGFTFAGATGVKAAFVNAIYQKQKEKTNGKSVYGQVGDPKKCCWYGPDRKWRISTTNGKDANKDTNNQNSYACSVEEGLHAPQLVNEWNVFPGGETVQPTATTTTTSHTEAQLQVAIVAHMAVVAIPDVTFTGATGACAAIVNGAYTKLIQSPDDTEADDAGGKGILETKNGKSVYSKVDDPKYCCWYSKTNQWTVGTIVAKESDEYEGKGTYAHSIQEGMAVPQLATKWSVYRGDDIGWFKIQPTVRINLTKLEQLLANEWLMYVVVVLVAIAVGLVFGTEEGCLIGYAIGSTYFLLV
jgi:hypothetical protein